MKNTHTKNDSMNSMNVNYKKLEKSIKWKTFRENLEN